jgi:eukaryotic-like serine/threonine-protein kinase
MSEPVPENQSGAGDELLAELTDDFVRRHRAGQRPSVEEYANRHPEFADQIRNVLSAVMAMEQPGLVPTLEAAMPPERIGASIGRYKLLQRIGEGGFGVVYMAEQTHPVRRKVALKLIKPGLDTGQVIARFEAERQALALMDHENIAKVLDAGSTDSGRPYFVMELVHGVPITDYCDKNQLPTRQRLELFVQVCRAVQHAHTKGIIHRDIKPTNVLVTLHEGGVAVPKVIDFGVAKATGQQLTEKTLFTHFAQMVGTPLYMSPEQAEMTGIDIDTRSDVYSLGVLLYELLTGTTPVDKERLKQAAFDEVRRIIREEEPPRPSTRLSTMGEQARSISAAQRKTDPGQLGRLVRGELDWIVMKTLEKDRVRRYETVTGLAHDVERYLNDEPVLACPPSAVYRLRKFVRRNKGPVAAAALVLLMLMGGIVGTSVGLVRAEQARRAEAERAEGERQARHEAQEREAETNAVLEFVENRILSAARPEGQEGGLGHDVTLRKAIEAALPFVEQSFADRPLIEARLRSKLGVSFAYLGEARTAAELFERARELYTEHLGVGHLDTLKSMHNLAASYNDLHRYGDAVKLAEETVALRKATIGPYHASTLMSMGSLANSYDGLGRLDDALKLREELLALHTAEFGLDHPDTFTSMNNLAGSYSALGRHAEALKLREETLSKTKLGAHHPDTLMSMNNLATSYVDLGMYDEALKLVEETLALQTAKLGAHHPDTLKSMQNLAIIYANLGQHAEALNLDEETLALLTRKLGPEHPDTLRSMNNLAVSYASVGRHDDALKLDEQILALREANLGTDHPATLLSMHNLACRFANLGRHDEALQLAKEALALRTVKLGPDHPDTLRSMHSLAIFYTNVGRHADALKLREETLALQKIKLGPDHPDTLSSMSNLAVSYSYLGRHNDALKLEEQILALLKAKLGPDHRDTLSSMYNLAVSYRDLERHDEALKLFEETLALQTTTLGFEHPDTLDSMRGLAYSYGDLGRHTDALKLHEQTLALRTATLGSDHPATLSTMHNLAMSYAELGRYDEAVTLNEETLALRTATLGSDHPATLSSMCNLAFGHARAGRYTEAVSLREATLPLQRAVLGPNHPDTIFNMLSLAACYADLRRHDDAIRMGEETLVLQKVVIGPDHPNTLMGMSNLAYSYTNLGRHDDALKVRQETLALQTAKLGPDHADTLSSMDNVALSLRELERFDEAAVIDRQVLDIRRRTLGEDHADTRRSRGALANDVARGLMQAGRLAEAESPLLANRTLLLRSGLNTSSEMQWVLESMATMYDATNRPERAARARDELAVITLHMPGTRPPFPDTLPEPGTWTASFVDEANWKAFQLRQAGRHEEAAALRDQVVTEAKRLFPPGHPMLLKYQNAHADLLNELKRMDQVEVQLLESYAGLESVGADEAAMQDVVERLVKLYESWDKAPEAATWRERLPITTPWEP